MKKVLIFLTLFFLFSRSSINAQEPTEEKHEAIVLKILEEKDIEILKDVKQSYQKVEVELTSGSQKGRKVTAELGGLIASNESQKVKEKDKIIVTHLTKIDGAEQYFISDFQRLNPLIILTLLFFLSVVFVGGIRGLSSFFGLIITFIILIKYIIPQIVSGGNPVFVAITGSFFIILTTLYLAHGINLKTTAALFGTIISLSIVGFLAKFSLNFVKLTGFSSEEATMLSMFPNANINLQGILLAGIIIGSLGVLDDITVSQSACVFELSRANKNLSLKELYQRGLQIGQDHIASLVNTLVLAYSGASLPLLLLFAFSGGEPINVLLTFK